MHSWIVPALIAAVTFLAFLPALRNGFVAWDDDKNFLANPHYRGLGTAELRWMWTSFHLGHYVPLSWMTLGLDYVLWGMNPAGYHFTNVLLHAANAVLLYFIARRLLRRTAAASLADNWDSLTVGTAFAALFFAVHPLRVESVVWVTERRDVLSGLFCLLSVLFYLRATEEGERKRAIYALSLGTFACALLSKATSMTVPALLLVLNVYPLRRVGGVAGWWGKRARRVYLEILPFAMLAAASAILSIVALQRMPQLSIPGKVAVSAYSLAFYVWKTLVPWPLSPVYEMPQHVDPLAPRFLASYACVLVLIALAWRLRWRWPGVTTAMIAFVVITLPMLGVVQNGPQIAADRYTYHAAPALAILAGTVYTALPSLRLARFVHGIVGIAIIVVLGVLTWNQSRVWHDSAALWSHVLRVDDESAIGHVGLANVLFRQNRVEEATEHARRAVAIAPGYAQAHNDLGVGLATQGHLDEAVSEYQRALALEPGNDEAHSNWGVVLARQGDLDGAIERYREALEANPDNADAHVNWGNAVVRLGNSDAGISHYEEALRIRPDHADAEHNWGVALAREGKLADAIEHFRRALIIDPDHAEAKEYLERAMQLLRGSEHAPERGDNPVELARTRQRSS